MRDDIFSDAYEDALEQRTGAAVLDALAAIASPRSFREVPTVIANDIWDDIGWMRQRLEAAGFPSVIVVDLTRPEFSIPVVRVIIPGLEGFSAHPNYRPGPRARHMETTSR
jgi:ribosomal protein S12 methylthiotransferase accessory factor